MRLLSIDVGIKNLAYCLFENKDESSFILDWDTVNISENEKLLCTIIDKKGLCDKPAKFKKDAHCYCLKHGKKVDAPTMKTPFIKKQKIGRLREIADKYHIPYETSLKRVNSFLSFVIICNIIHWKKYRVSMHQRLI